jgi:glucose-1-phosphatase
VTPAAPSLVLFDLDGVLVGYDRRRRMQHLGTAIGCDPDRIYAALFDAGLEARYDAGDIDSAQYLAELGQLLDTSVDPATWRAARAAAMDCTPATCARIAALAARCDIAILTNNGPLVIDALPHALASHFQPDRVFCSGALRLAKPSAEVFRQVVDRLGHAPHATLFLDDNPDNVAGARAAGLHAEHIERAGEFDAVLSRYGLA